MENLTRFPLLFDEPLFHLPYESDRSYWDIDDVDDLCRSFKGTGHGDEFCGRNCGDGVIRIFCGDYEEDEKITERIMFFIEKRDRRGYLDDRISCVFRKDEAEEFILMDGRIEPILWVKIEEKYIPICSFKQIKETDGIETIIRFFAESGLSVKYVQEEQK